MSAKRTLILTALIGLLFLSIFASPARAQAQNNCTFANPVHDGQPLEDSIISGMHAVGSGALPGLDGVGAIYPMFPGVLFAGTEPNPSGLVTTYVRIEGAGACEGWVMVVFHLAFAQGLENKIGSPIDENTLLGVDSMNGVAPQFKSHWHLDVGFRGARPLYVNPMQYAPTIVRDAVGSVVWFDPRDLLDANPPQDSQSQAPRAVMPHWSKGAWIALIVIIGTLFMIVVVTTGAARWGLQEVVHYFFWSWPIQWTAWRAGISGAILCTMLYMAGKIVLQVLEWNIMPSRVVAVELSSGDTSSGISPIFTPEVQVWGSKIVAWSGSDLDPNLVATIMQIESCGQQSVVSRSGAQGLFQVMPFHFAVGEDMLDPDTNADRGLAYLRQTITAYPDNINRAIAAYNGGIAGVSGDYETWATETKRYNYYGSGIYVDAGSGAESSERLNEWLAADGGRLCRSTLNGK